MTCNDDLRRPRTQIGNYSYNNTPISQISPNQTKTTNIYPSPQPQINNCRGFEITEKKPEDGFNDILIILLGIIKHFIHKILSFLQKNNLTLICLFLLKNYKN